jgi:hypothetical protein
VIVIGLIHGWRSGSSRRFLQSFAAMGAVALALCAAKIEATTALLSNLRRDFYALPGFTNPLTLLWVAFKDAFLWGSLSDGASLETHGLTFGPGEWQYGVGPVPLLLLTGAAVVTWRRGSQAGGSRASLVVALCLLTLPLFLNFYSPRWNAFLKSLPVIRNMSSLVRWFAAYIPVLAVGAGLAVDVVATARPRRWILAIAGAAVTIAWHAATDRANDQMIYSPDHVTNAWTAERLTHRVPTITSVSLHMDANHKPIRLLDSDDALGLGRTAALCCEPLVGYFDEALKLGHLHKGPITDVEDGWLNLKNPVCYLYPSENGCQPGDEFRAAQAGDAETFASYRPFAFATPARHKVCLAASAASMLFVLIVFVHAALTRTPRRAAEAS